MGEIKLSKRKVASHLLNSDTWQTGKEIQCSFIFFACLNILSFFSEKIFLLKDRDLLVLENLQRGGDSGTPPPPHQVCRHWWQTSLGAPSLVDTAQLVPTSQIASTKTPYCPASYRCQHWDASGQTTNCQSSTCLIQSTLGLIPYLSPC